MLRADLSLLAEAERAAREIGALTDRLDVLLNNAGGMADALVMTAEGFEANFAGNHLGPFVLTRRLLPLLRAAAADGPPGTVRIVNTAPNTPSSGGRRRTRAAGAAAATGTSGSRAPPTRSRTIRRWSRASGTRANGSSVVGSGRADGDRARRPARLRIHQRPRAGAGRVHRAGGEARRAADRPGVGADHRAAGRRPRLEPAGADRPRPALRREAGRFLPGYYDDARNNRLLPGEGVLPLADFVAALPADCPIGLEVPTVARTTTATATDHEARLRLAVAATRSMFDADDATGRSRS